MCCFFRLKALQTFHRKQLKTMLRYCIFLFCITLIGCAGEDYDAPISQATVDTDNESDFEEVLIDIEITTKDPTTQEVHYVLLDSIYDIAVDINNQQWGVFREDTGPVDPSGTGVLALNGFYVQKERVTYHLVLNYFSIPGDLQTAGEAADFLKGFLLPGDYFFRLRELKFNNAANEPTTISLSETQVLNIEPKERSVFVGTFNIEL